MFVFFSVAGGPITKTINCLGSLPKAHRRHSHSLQISSPIIYPLTQAGLEEGMRAGTTERESEREREERGMGEMVEGGIERKNGMEKEG